MDPGREEDHLFPREDEGSAGASLVGENMTIERRLSDKLKTVHRKIILILCTKGLLKIEVLVLFVLFIIF
jgi:hypothetical protein